MKNSLLKFDPKVIASIEVKIWKLYYKRSYVKLFFLFISLIKNTFHLSYLVALRLAYHLTVAIFLFKYKEGQENKKMILYYLENFYRLINKHIQEKFDHKKVAVYEMEWWFVDRYPDEYTISRRDAIRNAVLALYGVNYLDNPKKFQDYAHYRALAMELHDEAQKAHQETNWVKVSELLFKSFQSLHNEVSI